MVTEITIRPPSKQPFADPNITPNQAAIETLGLFGPQAAPPAEDMQEIEVNGEILEFPSSMSDQEIDNVLKAEYPQPEQQKPEGTLLNSGAIGLGDTLTMGTLDEITGGVNAIPALFNDKNFRDEYDKYLAKSRAEMEGAKEYAPITYAGGQVLGAMGPGAVGLKAASGIGKGLATYAPKLAEMMNAARSANMATRTVGAVAPAIGTGAVSGGVYGAGSGTGGSEQRLERAEDAAQVGAMLGPVGVAGARLARPLISRATGLVDRVRKAYGTPGVTPTVTDIAEQASVRTPAPITGGQETRALSKVEESLRKDFPDNYEQVIEAYKNGDVSLAELYGSHTRTRAKGAAQYASGNQRAQEFFEEKLPGSAERSLEAVKAPLGGSNAFYADLDDLVAKGQEKAKPLYEKAATDMVDETAPILKKPEIVEAIAKARKDYASELEGLPDNSIKVIDYAKKALDDDIGKAQRAGESNFARSRTSLKNELLDAADKASPSYKQARAAAGDYLKMKKAMDDGLKFDKLDPELLGKQLAKMTEPEREAIKIGVAKRIQNIIYDTQEGSNPYNRILGTPAKEQRMMKLLKPKEYEQLKTTLKAEDRLYRMRNEVLGGSPTTSKAVAAGDIADGSAIALDIAATGGLASMTKLGAIQLMKNRMKGLDDGVAGRIADIIFETDPVKKLYIIEKLGGRKGFTPEQVKQAKTIAFEVERQLRKNSPIGAALPAGAAGDLTEEQ